MPVIDVNLFEYLTKRAGYTLDDVAKMWDVSRSGVTRRLNGEVELRRSEMEAWMQMVGAVDAGPVFFPALLRVSNPIAEPAVGGTHGG